MSWYEFCISEEHAKALEKNYDLGYQLMEMRDTMCEVGTRKLKLFLNRLIKEGDRTAEILRTALEIEDENIVAKQNWYYSGKHYDKKEEYIKKLIDLCLELNIPFGIQNKKGRETSQIIYFELPHCEQISFHCNLSKEIVGKCPKCTKPWDEKINSTLPKLERAINEIYGEKIKERYCKPAKS